MSRAYRDIAKKAMAEYLSQFSLLSATLLFIISNISVVSGQTTGECSFLRIN